MYILKIHVVILIDGVKMILIKFEKCSPLSKDFLFCMKKTSKYSTVRFIKVHEGTKWTIRRGLMLLWFKGLINVTKKLQFIDPMF